MKTKTVQIAGKEVTLAYCYATEIIYSDYSGEDFQTFIARINSAGKSGGTSGATPTNVMHAILAAAVAYSNSKGEEPAIVDRDLMFDAKPAELVAALTAVVSLYTEWYNIPKGEPKEKKKKGKTSKN